MASATDRVAQIAHHFASPTSRSAGGVSHVLAKNPDDVVIVSAVRTPITRAKRGPFKDTHPEELLAAAFKGVLDRSKINPALVDDVIAGNVCGIGAGSTVARMAALYAGLPVQTSIATVNRQCSSGLQACAQIASSIRDGTIRIGIGAGFESMSMNYDPVSMLSAMNPSEKLTSVPVCADCLLPMGITSENVAKQFKVDRAKQDKLAAISHHRAAQAQKQGFFKEEIVPVKTTIKDKEGNSQDIVVDKDDGVRADTTFENLSRLKPAFADDGTTTAGNSSQVSDGAAAVLMMKRKTAEELRLPIIGKFVAFSSVGVPPNVMGIGPAFAVPHVLQKVGLKVSDIDIVEINEAFASQAVYCVEKLGLDMNKVNPKGGAIAIGHPLGCTGARQIATILPELKRQGKRIGVTTMCIGTGMGAAAVIVRE